MLRDTGHGISNDNYFFNQKHIKVNYSYSNKQSAQCHVCYCHLIAANFHFSSFHWIIGTSPTRPYNSLQVRNMRSFAVAAVEVWLHAVIKPPATAIQLSTWITIVIIVTIFCGEAHAIMAIPVMIWAPQAITSCTRVAAIWQLIPIGTANTKVWILNMSSVLFKIFNLNTESARTVVCKLRNIL